MTSDPAVEPPAEPAVRVVDKRWWARTETDDIRGEDTGRSTRPAYVEDLERQLAEHQARITEYADRHRRAADEFEQARERLRRTLVKEVERETRRILASFLDVVDNLDRALAAASDDASEGGDPHPVLAGIRLVRDELLRTLGGHGVTRLEAEGQPFDPNVHEALSMVPVGDAGLADTVVTVLKPGYLINEEVLRPAGVSVGKYEE